MTDPVHSRAWDKSNRGMQSSRRSQILSAAYSRRTAGTQASDGPVDMWVDDMDSDWDDWQEILVESSWRSLSETDVNRPVPPGRLAPVPLAPLISEPE